MSHNPDAEDVEECDDCLEIVTDPNFKNEIQAFALADRSHFDEILRRPRVENMG